MAKYSQEFKLEVVQYYLSGFGRHQVSHKFGIHHSDVAKWVANYNNHGAEGLSRKTQILYILLNLNLKLFSLFLNKVYLYVKLQINLI